MAIPPGKECHGAQVEVFITEPTEETIITIGIFHLKIIISKSEYQVY